MPDSDRTSIHQLKSQHRQPRWVSLDPSPRSTMKPRSSTISTRGPCKSLVLAKPIYVCYFCKGTQTKGAHPAQRDTDLSPALWTPPDFQADAAGAGGRSELLCQGRIPALKPNLCEKVFLWLNGEGIAAQRLAPLQVFNC